MLSYRVRGFFRRRGLPLLFVLAAFLGGFALVYFGAAALEGWAIYEAEDKEQGQRFLDDPSDLSTYTRVDLVVYGDGVLFRDGCQGLWLAMPYEKAFSIKRGEERKLDIRPTQHDLMQDIFTVYNITMSYARIERVEHGFFYATVLLDDGGTLLQLDTRPSDALALATRFRAPVYVYTPLLRQQGRNLCDQNTSL